MISCQTVVFEKMKVTVSVRMGWAYAIERANPEASSGLVVRFSLRVSAVGLLSPQSSRPPHILRDAGCFDLTTPPSRAPLREHGGKEKTQELH